MRLTYLLLMLSMCILTVFFTSTSQRSAADDIMAAVQKTNDNKYLKHASWGFAVQDVESGEMLVDFNGDKTLTPASAMKSITTATALAFLTDSFTYKTQLQYDGMIDKDGVLQGNIYIIGGGDPTLGYRRVGCSQGYERLMKQWTQAIKDAGIDSINGSIIGDASVFEMGTVPKHWLWQDMGNYYGAGASGLTMHENQYNLVFNGGRKQGAPIDIQYTIPELYPVDFVSEVVTGNRRTPDMAYVYTAPYSDEIYLRGMVPPSGPKGYIKGAIPDPPLYAAFSLHKYLRRAKVGAAAYTTMRRIRNNESPNTEFRGEKKPIFTTESPELKEIVRWVNKKSLNLHAEHLLKTIGLKRYEDGSTEHGIKATKRFWQSKGINLSGFQMEDGSGLSPLNKVSPKQFVNILSSAAKQDYFPAFLESLPEAGNRRDIGNLRYTLQRTKAAGNLRAKSGTLRGTRSYVGYVETDSGRLLSFAIMANNYTCSHSTIKGKMMSLLRMLAEAE